MLTRPSNSRKVTGTISPVRLLALFRGPLFIEGIIIGMIGRQTARSITDCGRIRTFQGLVQLPLPITPAVKGLLLLRRLIPGSQTHSIRLGGRSSSPMFHASLTAVHFLRPHPLQGVAYEVYVSVGTH